MTRRRIVSPLDFGLGIIMGLGSLVGWLSWVITGEGMWSVGLPASLGLVVGAWVVRREWRRKA